MNSVSSLQDLLSELRDYAARNGDAALLARIQQFEAALGGGSPINVGNITGSTAVAVGENIRVFVKQVTQQTSLPNDLLGRFTDIIERLERRAADTMKLAARRFSIFLASPSDVKDERQLAMKAIAQLQTDPLYRQLTIDVIAWDKPDDHLPLFAGQDPQKTIIEHQSQPTECDIFVALFWSRMGTPLDLARYTKADGGQYRSGTEWELDQAIQAYKTTGHPHIVIYRRTEKILLDPDADDFQERVAQRRAVQDFFAGFNNPDGSVRLAYNTYSTPGEFSDIFEHDLRKIIGKILEEERPTPKPESVLKTERTVTPVQWPDGQSPFPGLRAFGPKDAPVFFGRGAETDQLIRHLSDETCRFLAVVGVSGSGKSSLVGAGLIPRLRAGALPGSEDWIIATLTPDAWGNGDPFDSLTGALTAPFGLLPREVGQRLRAGPTGLRHMLEQHIWTDADKQRLLLFIDQFEEIFTRVSDEEKRSAFLEMLQDATRSERLQIVATLRDDFYRYCVQSSILARIINVSHGPFNLSAPAPLELHEMMIGPARVAGLQFEMGLIRRILADTGSEAGALALLAYALDQLYQGRDPQGMLNWDAYNNFGGVQGAIGERAQAVFDDLPAAARAALPRVFRELIEVDESGAVTRKRVALERVQKDEACARLAQVLVDARLLVTSRGSHDEALVEVAHEAIFRNWPHLKGWIDEVQDDLILLRQLRIAATLWKQHQRAEAYLWPGERLQPVYKMQERLKPELTDVEKAFIQPEFDRRMDEISNTNTSHRRRSYIGERIETLGDYRPGVGIVRDILPLRADNATPVSATALRPDEIRLWGDRPEHLGLPDIVWLRVEGCQRFRLETEEGNKGVFDIGPFYTAKYPITYTQFQAFVEAPNGFTNPQWWRGLPVDSTHKRVPGEQSFKFGNHPRDNVSWLDAIAFCRWLNMRLRWPEVQNKLQLKTLDAQIGLRLPTEWEWQWVATAGRREQSYPWGKDWDGERANTSENGLARTTAVGLYPAGVSPFGVMDLCGNVWEWCLSEYDEPTNIGMERSTARVVRGGSWGNNHGAAQTTSRRRSLPSNRFNLNGFRIVCRHQ